MSIITTTITNVDVSMSIITTTITNADITMSIITTTITNVDVSMSITTTTIMSADADIITITTITMPTRSSPASDARPQGRTPRARFAKFLPHLIAVRRARSFAPRVSFAARTASGFTLTTFPRRRTSERAVPTSSVAFA